MRARLMMKLMGAVMMLVLSVLTARSCSSTPSSSPMNPATLARNGVAALCANQAATAAAGGDSTGAGSGTDGTSLSIPSGDLSALSGMAGVGPRTFSCAPTTTAPPGN